MSELIRVERLHLTNQYNCSFCDRVPVSRVYKQTKGQYEDGIKNICFYFCTKCGESFAGKIKKYC
jgi:transcription elongation factor Elf1